MPRNFWRPLLAGNHLIAKGVHSALVFCSSVLRVLLAVDLCTPSGSGIPCMCAVWVSCEGEVVAGVV